jgi:membrane protein implicated in regulation of membrane protease activity
MSHVMIVIIALIAAVFLAGFCVKLLAGIVSLAFWLTIAAIKFGLFVLIAGVIFVLIYKKLKRKKNNKVDNV